MTFAKYQFLNPTEWATYKAQITDTEGNHVNCAIVEIGNICLAHDEEGNCTDLSPLYAVTFFGTMSRWSHSQQKRCFPIPSVCILSAVMIRYTLKDFVNSTPIHPIA